MVPPYWFLQWARQHAADRPEFLPAALSRAGSLDALLQSAPEPELTTRPVSDGVLLTAGKGIDLTGRLGCRAPECLKREIDSLFRHAWHYFDRILLPDQALESLMRFETHRDVSSLVTDLAPFVDVLGHLDALGALPLVEFEVRRPSCRAHYVEHAREAGIEHAVDNTEILTNDIASAGDIEWNQFATEDHEDIEYSLSHAWFEHTCWGALCFMERQVPREEAEIRRAIAKDVVLRYLAELSADASASKVSGAALGSTVALYRRLLAKKVAPQVEDIAFNLTLPVSQGATIASLIRLRHEEAEAFERFQRSLKKALLEKVRSGASDVEKVSREVQEDLIEPELRKIKDRLAGGRWLATRSSAAGVALGTATAAVGLLSATPFGTGVAIGGAVALAGASVTRAVEGYLTTRRDVMLSDMYFLWKAHSH